MKAVRSVTCGHLRNSDNYQSNPADEWTDDDIRLINAAESMRDALKEIASLTAFRHPEIAEIARDAIPT